VCAASRRSPSRDRYPEERCGPFRRRHAVSRPSPAPAESDVTFRYDVGGETYTRTTSFLGRPKRPLHSGEAIVVDVVPWYPRWARIAGEAYGAPAFAAIFLLFPIIGVALTRSSVRTLRRGTRAYREGVLTSGLVVFAGPDGSVTVNGRHPHKVEWIFSVNESTPGASPIERSADQGRRSPSSTGTKGFGFAKDPRSD